MVTYSGYAFPWTETTSETSSSDPVVTVKGQNAQQKVEESTSGDTVTQTTTVTTTRNMESVVQYTDTETTVTHWEDKDVFDYIIYTWYEYETWDEIDTEVTTEETTTTTVTTTY